MLSQIFGALATLREFIQVGREIIALAQKAQEERWFEKSNQVFTELKLGTTSEQKTKSAQEIQDLIKGL